MSTAAQKGSAWILGNGSKIVSERTSTCGVGVLCVVVTLEDIVRMVEKPGLKTGEGFFEMGG